MMYQMPSGLPSAGQDSGSGDVMQAIMMMLGAKGKGGGGSADAGVMSGVDPTVTGYVSPGGYAPPSGLSSYDAPSYDYAPGAVPNVQPGGPYAPPVVNPASQPGMTYDTGIYGQLGYKPNNSY